MLLVLVIGVDRRAIGALYRFDFIVAIIFTIV